MTFSQPADAEEGRPIGPLLLLAHGPEAQVRELLTQAGPRLASALNLPWRGFRPSVEPRRLLAELPSGLIPLPQDPGQPLPGFGHWAEALGAWHQPALVVLTAAQAGWGLAAASTALLRQHGVPLVGLVQWGGPWDLRERRLEALPWLGWLPAEPAAGAGALPGAQAASVEAAELDVLLASALAARWRSASALLAITSGGGGGGPEGL